jgi:hypothetical protein
MGNQMEKIKAFIQNLFSKGLRVPGKDLTRPRMKVLVELIIIFLVAYFFCRGELLNFNPSYLQQSGEHNESAIRPLLAEIGLRRYGEIPLWNFIPKGKKNLKGNPR